MIRIGHGYDVHKFSELVSTKGIRLGGIQIDHDYHLIAHSDGDVLIHALCDGLLGAAALGDIGKHFPDNNPKYKDIDSTLLLINVNELVNSKGYSIGNIDISIEAEAPKMTQHIPNICQKIAHLLDIPVEDVNVKATTTEGLGFVGRSEGIAVHAVVLIYEN